MKMTLIYPKWPKLERQTEFHLPPHGPVVFAAEIPPEVDLTFVDENVQFLDTAKEVELVAISTMLTSQLPRAYEIAGEYLKKGIQVIFEEVATVIPATEVMGYAVSVFLGEVEGRFGE